MIIADMCLNSYRYDPLWWMRRVMVKAGRCFDSVNLTPRLMRQVMKWLLFAHVKSSVLLKENNGVNL